MTLNIKALLLLLRLFIMSFPLVAAIGRIRYRLRNRNTQLVTLTRLDPDHLNPQFDPATRRDVSLHIYVKTFNETIKFEGHTENRLDRR